MILEPLHKDVGKTILSLGILAHIVFFFFYSIWEIIFDSLFYGYSVDYESLIFILEIMLWNIFPYLVFYFLVRLGNMKSNLFGIFVLAFPVIFLHFITIVTMLTDTSSTTGLILLFVPLWQIVGLIIFALPAKIFVFK